MFPKPFSRSLLLAFSVSQSVSGITLDTSNPSTLNQKCSRYRCTWPHEILYRQCHQYPRYYCGTASAVLLVGSWCYVGDHARLLSLHWRFHLQ
ncbi:hypothetical protein BofuT4_uP051320.1 [Botrytis cinerea T4]|uniref:Secreted protein n=1 Tax=Botryotinia fuckeliana (strain T4) TaxID=999810 RepID=G2XWV5_BOTF4|nr:hypothetical protein BofuT4_uP051320.1 [Botrytis cinerea T4]